jgi:hypothetical protein
MEARRIAVNVAKLPALPAARRLPPPILLFRLVVQRNSVEEAAQKASCCYRGKHEKYLSHTKIPP